SAFSTLVSLSILRKITSQIAGDLQSTVDDRHRELLTSPKFSLPIQATLLSLVVSNYFSWFIYPFELNVFNAFLLWLVFALTLVILWFWQKRRSIKFIQIHYAMSASARLLRAGISFVFFVALIG
ncbi:hypothetical protein, partial [Shimazuella alba]